VAVPGDDLRAVLAAVVALHHDAADAGAAGRNRLVALGDREQLAAVGEQPERVVQQM